MIRSIGLLLSIIMLAGCGVGTGSPEPARSSAAECASVAAVRSLISQMHEAYDKARAGDDKESVAKGVRLVSDVSAFMASIDIGKGPTQDFNTALYVTGSNIETVGHVLADDDDDAAGSTPLAERIDLAEEPLAGIDHYWEQFESSAVARGLCPAS